MEPHPKTLNDHNLPLNQRKPTKWHEQKYILGLGDTSIIISFVSDLFFVHSRLLKMKKFTGLWFYWRIFIKICWSHKLSISNVNKTSLGSSLCFENLLTSFYRFLLFNAFAIFRTLFQIFLQTDGGFLVGLDVIVQSFSCEYLEKLGVPACFSANRTGIVSVRIRNFTLYLK